MVNIRCYKCGAKSLGDTMEQARSIMNHAVGLSRGIKCGDNYNAIEEIKDTKVETDDKGTIAVNRNDVKDNGFLTDEQSDTKPETPKDDDQNDSPTDTAVKEEEKEIPLDAKPSNKSKSKKFSY